MPNPVRPTAPAIDAQWEADVANPVRRMTFYFALAAIFIRFSAIHEVIAVVLNLNLYLLYIVMPPAILGVIASGGLRRALKANTSRYWLAFMAWLVVAIPFSSWRGDSANQVYGYAKAEFIMLFVIAGLVMTWKECKLVMITLALAGVTDLGVGRIFMKQGSDRIDLDLGGSTIANSNDMAVHLILMMAFLFYIVLAPKMPKILKVACLPAIGYGIFLILSSGSRGALIALIVCSLFSFLMGSPTYRMLLLVILPVVAAMIMVSLPRTTLLRLATLASDSEDAAVQGDAEGSSDTRRELLKTSIRYTFEHPIFGVGPGQFSNFEGGQSQKEGKHGIWHATHNSFTAISSECGIPGLILFLAGIVSAFRLAFKTNRLARANQYKDIAAVTFCLMLGMVGFYTAIMFVNFGYFFYEPALCGLCIVIYYAAQHEMSARQFRAAATPAAAPLWAPAQPLKLR